MKSFILNIKDLEFSELERLAKKFPKRFLKAKSYQNPDDYYRSMGAYLLLEKALGDFKENEIQITPEGKPFIKGKDFFSYSHSGDFVVLATSKVSEVGVDIEKISPSRLYTNKKIFNEKEIDFINKNPNVNFFILWTRKESLLKLIGKGIQKTTLNDIDVTNEINDYNNKKIYQTTELLDDYVISYSSFFNEEMEN